jgi:hypothetical protein
MLSGNGNYLADGEAIFTIYPTIFAMGGIDTALDTAASV